ncbi:MAG: enoyl-CoA hydratase/isomerase family protein [Rhodospirillales bacterium]|nr:MAG: enoyl-CoA hydratase/isomerase family protein [Rhodospirillales bacterium]
MNSDYETLAITEPEPHLLLLTLNRPHAANAFNTRMGEELRAFWTTISKTGGDPRCIVVTGAGDRAFCAGADLKERRAMSDDAWRRQHVIFEEAFYAMMDCPLPLIAAVNGAAYGGGFEIVLACDFAYAADHARFALPETGLGIMPGVGGTQNLPRACGVRRAKEIILTGTPFDAEAALRWGIVSRVLPMPELLDETLAVARRIASNAPLAVRAAKQALNAAIGTDIKTGLAIEIECYNQTVTTADRREGMLAFNEKRRPNFRGE